jgi:hypothetical protein
MRKVKSIEFNKGEKFEEFTTRMNALKNGLECMRRHLKRFKQRPFFEASYKSRVLKLK